MASGTLSIEFGSGGATVYAVVRRLTGSDWYVWNGSSFGAYSAGSWSTYAVAMTDDSAGLYTVAFPSAIAGGDYVVSYYDQSGGSPATTDLRLTWEEFHWDGAALTTTSSVSLSAYALTDLDSVKRYIGITVSTADTKLTELINAVSAQIERITGVNFKAREYRQWFNGDRQARLLLRYRPVQRITRIAYGQNTALSVTYSGSAIDATAAVYVNPEDPTDGGVRLSTVASNGTETNTNLAFTSYPSVQSLATAIALVSGWAATVQKNCRSMELHQTGGEDALGRSVFFTYPDQRQTAFRLDDRLGTVQFTDGTWAGWWPSYSERRGGHHVFSRDFQGICCIYRAGWETIPADVGMLANRLIAEVYWASTKDTSLASFRLGDYSQQIVQRKAQDVRDALSEYMDGANLIGGAI